MGSASPMVGTVPHDTSWEDWDQLRQDHHLENKVILQGPKEDDSTAEPIPEREIGITTTNTGANGKE